MAVRELQPEDPAKVLKNDIEENPIIKPYFVALVNSAQDEFEDYGKTQPVFKLIKVEIRRDDD